MVLHWSGWQPVEGQRRLHVVMHQAVTLAAVLVLRVLHGHVVGEQIAVRVESVRVPQPAVAVLLDQPVPSSVAVFAHWNCPLARLRRARCCSGVGRWQRKQFISTTPDACQSHWTSCARGGIDDGVFERVRRGGGIVEFQTVRAVYGRTAARVPRAEHLESSRGWSDRRVHPRRVRGNGKGSGPIPRTGPARYPSGRLTLPAALKVLRPTSE